MDKGSHLKIGFVGEQGVGKTHILNKYLTNKLPSNPASTIAVQFATTIFQMKDGTRFKLQLWDTAGHQKYKEIVCVHLKNADGIIIVYDLLNRKKVESWIQKTKVECEEDPSLMIFGNKLDLIEKNPMSRKVEIEEGKKVADKHGIVFHQTTVRRLQGIQNAIDQMLENIVLKKAVKNLENIKDRIDKQQEVPSCNMCNLY